MNNQLLSDCLKAVAAAAVENNWEFVSGHTLADLAEMIEHASEECADAYTSITPEMMVQKFKDLEADGVRFRDGE